MMLLYKAINFISIYFQNCVIKLRLYKINSEV